MDKVRANIAYWLLFVFGATIGLDFGAVAGHWASPNDVRNLAAPIISAEVSLLGAVTGFYYASHRPPAVGSPVSAQSENGSEETDTPSK